MTAYFDWAATAPPDPEALNLQRKVSEDTWQNPSSAHQWGRSARAELDRARSRSAGALGVSPESLIFTSGGTEADHIPMLSLLLRPAPHSIAVSAVEHPAVTEQAKVLSRLGWKVASIPVDSSGRVSAEGVLSSLSEDTVFVAVMAVNNETGAIQPVEEIASALIRHSRGKRKIHFHVDAVQGIGKIPLNLSAEGIDSASLSAHKLGGPRGIGLLYLNRPLEGVLRGGGQESGLRPGTENVAAAAACALALERTVERMNAGDEADGRGLSRGLFANLCAVRGIAPIPRDRKEGDCRFSPFIMQFTNDRFPGEVLVRALSDRGIAVSTGSACSSKKKNRPVLEAMKISSRESQNAFRVSTGYGTTRDETEALVAALSEIMGAT